MTLADSPLPEENRTGGRQLYQKRDDREKRQEDNDANRSNH